MATTVSALIEVLEKTCPSNPKWNVKTEMPQDPEVTKKLKDLKEQGNFSEYKKLIFNTLPQECDQVQDNLYIGGILDVENLTRLQSKGITHIINVADGQNSTHLYTVNKEDYKTQGICYEGITISDLISSEHDNAHESKLRQAIELLDNTLQDQTNKVLLTCMGGMSRSATVIICYLMIKQKKSAEEAITQLRACREVIPSKQQLIYVAKLHNRLQGLDNIDVVDTTLEMSTMRQVAIQNDKKPTTVDEIHAFMMSIDPPEVLVKDDLPINPEHRSRAKEIFASRDMEKIVPFLYEISTPAFVEMHSRFWLGNVKSTLDLKKLQELHINAIVNVAHGPVHLGFFEADVEKLKAINVDYYGITIDDLTKKGQIEADKEKAYLKAVDIIDNLLKDENKQVMVTCYMGMSRSATVAILYLMLKQKLSLTEAIIQVRKKRDVQPNKTNLLYVVKQHHSLLPASVQTLHQHMISIVPPERLIEYDTQMPIDPEKKVKHCQALKSKDMKIIAEYAENTLSQDLYLEIFPRLLIGNKKSVEQLDKLKSHGITGVVNMAHGTKLFQYNCQSKLQDIGVEYHGISLSDFIDFEVNEEHEKALLQAPELIDELLKKNEKNKILVTCFAGMSRSATALILYLMTKENMSAFDAITHVRQCRDVFPSKDQLLYVARVHNKTFGFEDHQVLDFETKDDSFRQAVKDSKLEA